MNDKIISLDERRAVGAEAGRWRAQPPLPPGGGDGTFGGMQERVTALEKAFDKIDGKLDRIIADTSAIRVDLARATTRMESLATTDSVTAVAAALKDKPGVWQALIIALVVSGLTVAAALGGAARFFPSPPPPPAASK